MSGDILTRGEAAEFLRVSVRAFDQHVRGNVPEHRVGRKPLFRKVDLEEWLDRQKVGRCGNSASATTCASRSTVSAWKSPRALEILKKLRAEPARSTASIIRIRSVSRVADITALDGYDSVPEDGRAAEDERRGMAEACRAVA